MSDPDKELIQELWRALIIVLRAMVKRYGFQPPKFND